MVSLFALSPLSLDRFPFKINRMVENMHSTATDEAVHVSTVFVTFSSVQTPEQKRIFVHLTICLILQIFLHELLLQPERQRGAFAADEGAR